MDNLKKFFKAFVQEEEGMEFLQIVFVIAGVCLVGAAIYILYQKIETQVNNATSQVEGLTSLGSGSSSSSSTLQP